MISLGTVIVLAIALIAIVLAVMQKGVSYGDALIIVLIVVIYILLHVPKG